MLVGDDTKHKEYREKLLGPDLIIGVPEAYAEMSVIDKVGYGIWQYLSLKEKAKLIAYYRLENMSELLKEHLRMQDQAKKSK